MEEVLLELVSITGSAGGIGLYNKEQAEQVLKLPGYCLTFEAVKEKEDTEPTPE